MKAVLFGALVAAASPLGILVAFLLVAGSAPFLAGTALLAGTSELLDRARRALT